MASVIDIINETFGQLTVIERNGSRGNRALWKCQCSCGNIIDVTGSDLRRGRKKDCGCVAKAKKDLTNHRSGTLVALYPTDKRSKNGGIMWHCKCDCGNEIDVEATKIKNNKIQSCGCERTKHIIEQNKKRAIDLTGKKIGKLSILYPTDKRNSNRDVMWHCKCDCGNECDVSSHKLINKSTKSCGCMRNKSYGEDKIMEILNKNNITFKREFTPKNYQDYFSFRPRYDFYILEKQYFIEYDGSQHIISGTGTYDNPEKFKIIQQHDQEKNQYCKNNSIPLIRIPYTQYDNLCIEDLLLDTTSFLV